MAGRLRGLMFLHDCSGGELMDALINFETERLERTEGVIWDSERGAFVRKNESRMEPIAFMSPAFLESQEAEAAKADGFRTRSREALATDLELIAADIRRGAIDA
jgi:hypothetical protein